MRGITLRVARLRQGAGVSLHPPIGRRPAADRSDRSMTLVASSPEWLTVPKVVAVPARVDGAVTEANELIDGLCSSRARHRNGSAERQKTQYMTHATPPGISISAYHGMISAAVANAQQSNIQLRRLATMPRPVTN